MIRVEDEKLKRGNETRLNEMMRWNGMRGI